MPWRLGATGVQHVARVVDDAGAGLLAEFDAALQRSPVRVGIGDLVEDQRGPGLEPDRALLDALAEQHELVIDARLQGQTMMHGAVAVHHVHPAALVIEADAHFRSVIDTAYEQDCHRYASSAVFASEPQATRRPRLGETSEASGTRGGGLI